MTALGRSMSRAGTGAGAGAGAGTGTRRTVRTPRDCRETLPRKVRGIARRGRRSAGAREAAASRQGLTYKQAGVDIDAASDLIRRIQKMCPDIGGFGGIYPLNDDQFLVAGTDGVGTKLKIAFEMDSHDTIGIDLVAMSVNDIITSGARPLFFLDYFATGKLDVSQAEQVIEGIVAGCRESGCALLGGETAEMPGFYGDGEYDLSGFAVGLVAKDRLIDGRDISVGDVLVGLPSSGIHSNGYSLARKILSQSGLSLGDPFPGVEGKTVGEVLLQPTRLYVNQLLDLHDKFGVKGAVHVTGGGFYDNIPRVLPKGWGASVSKGSWEVLPVFRWLQESGRVSDEEMFRTFNMGIGFITIMAPDKANEALKEFPDASIIGQVTPKAGVHL